MALQASAPDKRPLKVLHVFRAPLGGLFRHVADLVQGQIARGHEVGIICERTPRGEYPERILAGLQGQLALGLTRIPIGRQLGPDDFFATRHVSQRIAQTKADVVHGHGAKGGAYTRLAMPRFPAIRAYTPHGGSLLYKPGTLGSRFYVTLEKILLPRTDLFLFESAYIGERYRAMVGEPRGLVRVVHNGVGAKEFIDRAPRADATDILFIGELRPIKGVDVLIKALAALRRSGLPLRATIVGDGATRAELHALTQRLGLTEMIAFHKPMPARDAFALARLAVIPSRGESLPYIVLELAAAGVPLITTAVGGNPEIFGPQSDLLIPADDPAALGAAIARAVNDPETMRAKTAILRERVRAVFSVESMIDGALAAYREALQKRHFV